MFTLAALVCPETYMNMALEEKQTTFSSSPLTGGLLYAQCAGNGGGSYFPEVELTCRDCSGFSSTQSSLSLTHSHSQNSHPDLMRTSDTPSIATQGLAAPSITKTHISKTWCFTQDWISGSSLNTVHLFTCRLVRASVSKKDGKARSDQIWFILTPL